MERNVRLHLFGLTIPEIEVDTLDRQLPGSVDFRISDMEGNTITRLASLVSNRHGPYGLIQPYFDAKTKGRQLGFDPLEEF